MGVLSMFNSQKLPLKIDKPIRLIELFAGVGSQAKALKRLGANFEHYRICDFDKYAIKSYNAIHGTDFVTSDITQITADDLGVVDTDKYCYIMTYSFPCQDLSLAGKGKGMAKGENTRSGLLWEVERLLNECAELPQILLMENVTQVHGKKNKEHFDEWIAFLKSKGYSNYWQDLNAKNFGIPQNRNRTFMVSVLGDYTYEFPKEFPLELRLKDMLEDSVDEKFYISNAQMEKIVNWKAQQKPFERVLGRESISQTLTARGAGEYHSGMIVFSPENENTTNMQSQVKEITQKDNFVCKPKINVVGNYSPSSHDASRIVDVNGLAPTVKENHGTGTAITEPYDKKDVKLPCSTRGGQIASTLRATIHKQGARNITENITNGRGYEGVVESQLRIRKLTPKECWRLMVFYVADFEKATAVNSNSQLYKQAGNSIVVDVLYYIFREML